MKQGCRDGVYSLQENPQYANQPATIYVANKSNGIYKIGIAKNLKTRQSIAHYKNYLWSKNIGKRCDAFAIEQTTCIQSLFARELKNKRTRICETRQEKVLSWEKAVEFILWNEKQVELFGWLAWLEAHTNAMRDGAYPYLLKPFFIEPTGFRTYF